MFGKSKVQKDFKKQMQQIEKDMHQKEIKGEGAFSNKIYKEKFYGNSSKAKTTTYTIRRVKDSIIFIFLGIIISSMFTGIYQNTVAVLFYNLKKGSDILRIAYGTIIILPHLAITQGIIYFSFKRFRRKALIVLSLYNLILTLLIAMLNITLLMA